MHKHLLFFLFIVLVASCTVEKRVHQPGWHVEWNKRQLSDRNTASAGKLPEPVSAAALIRTGDDTSAIAPEALPLAEESATVAAYVLQEAETPAAVSENRELRPTTDTDAGTEATALQESHPQRYPQQVFAYDPDEVPVKLPVDPVIMAMWILDLVLVILTVLLVMALLASTGTWLLTFGVLIYYLIPVVFTANIVLSIVAYDRRRNDPDRFRKSPILLALFAGLFCAVGILLFGLIRLAEKWL